MNKRILLRGVVTGLLAIPIIIGIRAWSENITHKVVKDDTLWDIAGKYYNNPWKWKKIWESNSETIGNPDLIFPEQVFVIPEITETHETEEKKEPETAPLAETETPKETPEEPEVEQPVEESAGGEVPVVEEEVVEEVKKTNKEEVEEVVEVEEETEEKVTVPKIKSGHSYITKDLSSFEGRLMKTKEKRLYISQGDVVYINIGTDKGLKPGTKCCVLRRGGKVVDPLTKKFKGYQINEVGLIKITSEINETTATAIVIRSYEPLRIGDYIKIIESK